MSLFAAYQTDTDEKKTNETPSTDESSWLKNSSFALFNAVNPVIGLSHHHHDHHHHQPSPRPGGVGRNSSIPSKKQSTSSIVGTTSDAKTDDSFAIDTHRCTELYSVDRISRPSAPIYKVRHSLCRRRNDNTGRFKRYYQHEVDNSTTDLTVASPHTKEEENLTNTTCHYNRELAKDPHNVHMWLRYVHFQDVLYQFETSKKKGSMAKALRALAEKKLLILEKALNYNGDADQLTRERLRIAVNAYPADELQTYLRRLIDKDQSSIILWQGYIESYQCSMTHCNSSTVLKLYSKCLVTLHTLRRFTKIPTVALEQSILTMLHQCGLFLKQTGLFEQLWTLLKLYLDMNLASPIDREFQCAFHVADNYLEDLEEIVFKSQLPMHEMWFRIEKLREACNWLPHDDSTNKPPSVDPQRLVFLEDVNDLVHPITLPENNFKLIATVLHLLKIPILPCRHTTLQLLGFDLIPWSYDAIESLLPIYYNATPIHVDNVDLSRNINLAVGPQFLRKMPGQIEYLDFIVQTMKHCADNTNGTSQMAIMCWWIRFQRLLFHLNAKNIFSIPDSYVKKMKTQIKKSLRNPKYSDNAIYYCELALIELETGDVDGCISKMQAILKSVNLCRVNGVLNFTNLNNKLYCHIVRLLIEIYVRNGSDKTTILCQMFSLVLDQTCIATTEEAGNNMLEAKSEFEKYTAILLENFDGSTTVADHLLPSMPIDWIMCHGWFLYFTEDIQCFIAYVNGVLEKISCPYAKEVLYEFYVAILFKHESCKFDASFNAAFHKILVHCIEEFPNNLFITSIVNRKYNIYAGSNSIMCYEIKKTLLGTGRALPIVYWILATVEAIDLESRLENSVAFQQRTLALFRNITMPATCTKRCGLIWRLYLHYVYTNYDANVCKNVYYCAVEECPWLKSLYMDAAIYMPNELTQIQDLIIEKELRLHVTPEELEILSS